MLDAETQLSRCGTAQLPRVRNYAGISPLRWLYIWPFPPQYMWTQPPNLSPTPSPSKNSIGSTFKICPNPPILQTPVFTDSWVRFSLTHHPGLDPSSLLTHRLAPTLFSKSVSVWWPNIHHLLLSNTVTIKLVASHNPHWWRPRSRGQKHGHRWAGSSWLLQVSPGAGVSSASTLTHLIAAFRLGPQLPAGCWPEGTPAPYQVGCHYGSWFHQSQQESREAGWGYHRIGHTQGRGSPLSCCVPLTLARQVRAHCPVATDSWTPRCSSQLRDICQIRAGTGTPPQMPHPRESQLWGDRPPWLCFQDCPSRGAGQSKAGGCSLSGSVIMSSIRRCLETASGTKSDLK